ncbi:MAG: hypothetical protein ACR2RE_18180 [Geminicoccaceae bacterium]
MFFSRLAPVMLVALSLTGCSVGMALSGEETPDLTAVKVGAAKDDVDFQLGVPEKIEELAEGTKKATYKYEVGNDPNAIRAIGHGALDVASIGLWEFIGTPIEASTGEEREVVITFDAEERVTRIEQLGYDA